MVSPAPPELEAPLLVLPLPRVDVGYRAADAPEAADGAPLQKDSAALRNDAEGVRGSPWWKSTPPSASTTTAAPELATLSSERRGEHAAGLGGRPQTDDHDVTRRLPSRVWRVAFLAAFGLVAVLAAATCFEVAAFRRACVEVTVSFKSSIPGVNLTQIQDPSFRNRFQTHYARELLRAAKSPGASVSFQDVDTIEPNDVNGIRILTSIHFLRRDEKNGIPGSTKAGSFVHALQEGSLKLVRERFVDLYGHIQMDISSIKASFTHREPDRKLPPPPSPSPVPAPVPPTVCKKMWVVSWKLSVGYESNYMPSRVIDAVKIATAAELHMNASSDAAMDHIRAKDASNGPTHVKGCGHKDTNSTVAIFEFILGEEKEARVLVPWLLGLRPSNNRIRSFGPQPAAMSTCRSTCGDCEACECDCSIESTSGRASDHDDGLLECVKGQDDIDNSYSFSAEDGEEDDEDGDGGHAEPPRLPGIWGLVHSTSVPLEGKMAMARTVMLDAVAPNEEDAGDHDSYSDEEEEQDEGLNGDAGEDLGDQPDNNALNKNKNKHHKRVKKQVRGLVKELLERDEDLCGAKGSKHYVLHRKHRCVLMH